MWPYLRNSELFFIFGRNECFALTGTRVVHHKVLLVTIGDDDKSLLDVRPTGFSAQR